MAVEEQKIESEDRGAQTVNKENNAGTGRPQEEDSKNPPEEGKQTFMQAATSEALRPFVIISTSYLLFTGA